MTTTELDLNAHHKVYDATSPVVEVPKGDILGGADPRHHGLVLQRPGEAQPYASVRPPYFRTNQGDKSVHADDIVPLHMPYLERDQVVVPSHTKLTVGDEMELLTLAETVRLNGHRQIRPDWTADQLEQDLKKRGVATSSEVWKYMVEINGLPTSSLAAKAAELRSIGQAMAEAAEDLNLVSRFLPISTQPFLANPEDVNDHPYVQRMVMDFLRFANVADLGCSYQVHVQALDINSSIFVINAARQLPPIFMAMALNGAFTQHQDTGLLSGREQARRNMATAGTNRRLPEWNKALNYGVGVLKQGTAPSLPRTFGQHTDYRFRLDIGTTEFSFLDNPGGNIDKLLMFQSLFRLTTWRLYRAYKDQQTLPTRLFNDSFDDWITTNKKAVEKDGTRAVILDGEYNLTSVENQLDHLLSWIKSDPQFEDDPEYPISQLETEMANSLRVPTFKTLASTSMAEYYATGLGTPGHYQRARYEHLVDRVGPVQAINATLVNYADSYHQYLKSL